VSNKVDKLIIGLGNPGTKYANSRHNIGYDIAINIIKKYNGCYQSKLNIVNYSIINIKEKNVLIALPQTYMNHSGIAAQYLLDKYNIESANMLVILDEYNFPLNKIHIKKVKSDGGHNGLSSILEITDANDFYILRCGIDKDFGSGEMANYVLSKFKKEDQYGVDLMINNVILAIEFYIENEIGKSLSYINSGKYLLL